MDEAAPITWLIDQINQIVASGANAAAGAIASAVAPLAAVCFGIYIILICVSYMKGAESEPVLDFGLRVAGFAVIIGLGLNASVYSSTVIPIVTGLGPDLANAVSGGTATAGTLDQLALHYLKILDEGYESSNTPVFPFNVGPLVLYLIKAACTLIGLIPFLVAATIVLIVANVGSMLVAMVGPLFFAFLIFPATRQYFSAWVNTALSYALIPIFVAVVATISVGISKAMFGGSGTLDDISLKTVFLAALGNLALVYLLKQVSALASSLSAGGINASMPGSIGTLASGIRNGARGSSREVAAGVRGGSAAYQAAKRAHERFRNNGNSISNNRRAG